jgi:prepilin-type N-terminal cleavage/methylation domain-containing protein
MKAFRWGFTIVELLIVLAVMGILIGLAVVSMSAAQVDSRDNERKVDAESIATYLEAMYTEGDPVIGSHYPATVSIDNIENSSIDQKALRAPEILDSEPISLIPATNNTQTTAGVLPQPTVDTYVYQPISSDGTSLCTEVSDPCRSFNIYYMLEKDSTVHRVESRNK